jgi:hypothetical protein
MTDGGYSGWRLQRMALITDGGYSGRRHLDSSNSRELLDFRFFFKADCRYNGWPLHRMVVLMDGFCGGWLL